MEAPASDSDLVWGTSTYVDSFLQQALSQLDLRLRALGVADLSASLISCVLAPLWLMPPCTCFARTFFPRYIHLFRFLPVDRSLQLAREVDSRLLPWLQDRLDLPLDSPQVRVIRQTLTAHGGLSPLRLHHEALRHCISGLLALPAKGVPLTPTEHDSLTLATAVLQRLAGVNAPGVAAHLLPHRRAAHLRRVVYEALLQTLVTECPWLLPPPSDAAATKAEVMVRFQYRLLLGWFDADGPHLLTAPVLRHAFAVHCRIPLFPLPARCQYVTPTSDTACMHQIQDHEKGGLGLRGVAVTTATATTAETAKTVKPATVASLCYIL